MNMKKTHTHTNIKDVCEYTTPDWRCSKTAGVSWGYFPGCSSQRRAANRQSEALYADASAVPSFADPL